MGLGVCNPRTALRKRSLKILLKITKILNKPRNYLYKDYLGIITKEWKEKNTID